ncbi:MAG: chromosome partitioning protein ParB [Deltaproteobacteria bacterium]|nr:MAG: chromosome partitioning protein ParB [Deltaproteobacteria bacterium]
MAAKRARRKPVKPSSVGLSVAEVAAADTPREVASLTEAIEAADGAVLAHYRDPIGGAHLLLAALPVERVAATPFQRELSEPHAKRLQKVFEQLGSFLDPIIAVAAPQAQEPVRFWTPNGLHRLSALLRLGAKTVTALVSPDPALAYRILALNTEKAHNLRDRAREALRMAQGLAEIDPKRKETEFALELDEPSLVTIGFAYAKRPRFAGGAYAPALRASDAFAAKGLDAMLALREACADRLLAIDDRVAEIVKALQARGFESPYLKNFVVARLRPFRPRGKPAPAPDALLDHMERAAAKFNVDRVREDQLARAPGAADD